MKCEKCGGEWIPPKNMSASLTNCPFCGTPVLDADTAKGYTDMGEFLQYLVSLYGIDLYNNQRKLSNLIADLYQGDERMKCVCCRAIIDDSLSKRIYDLSKKPLDEREAYYNQIINQFSETNFYAVDFGKQVIENFVSGLQLEIIVPISTKATDEDGEWIDEFGVKYSADRKKLIKGNGSLETYKIREGTVIICDDAWRWISNLRSIIIPDSVINIGTNAFGGCESLTSIIIPNSVTNIGNSAFYECKSLTSIVIPNSVTSIGDEAFYRCESLTSIVIPDSVTSIGEWAFGGCESLTSILIPSSVTSIGGGAFIGCENIKITLESNKYFVIINDVLYTSDIKKIVWCYSKGSYINIPDSVTSIGDGAFSCCESLVSIAIPSSVTSIGDEAFYYCESLTSIVIPDSVTSIGEDAFSGCKSLTSIVIPDSVTSIGEDAFSQCESLVNVLISNSVISIGDGAFSGCKSLINIKMSDLVTNIGDYTFYGCESLKNIVIPSSVTSIGQDVFWECKSLTSITIPDSVISIGGGFWTCSSLTSIFIPQNTTEKFKQLLPEGRHQLLIES